MRSLIHRPRLAWALGWAVTGAGLVIADVFSVPRRGPLWIAILAGVAGWSLGGAATAASLTRSRRSETAATGAVIWGASYLVALVSGATLSGWFESRTIGPVASAGVLGGLIAWSGGAGLAILAMRVVGGHSASTPRAILLAAAWVLGFAAGAALSVVAGLILAQSTGALLRQTVGEAPGLWLGWSGGFALGGWTAAALSIAAARMLAGLETEP
jgi:hypothetical protein